MGKTLGAKEITEEKSLASWSRKWKQPHGPPVSPLSLLFFLVERGETVGAVSFVLMSLLATVDWACNRFLVETQSTAKRRIGSAQKTSCQERPLSRKVLSRPQKPNKAKDKKRNS